MGEFRGTPLYWGVDKDTGEATVNTTSKFFVHEASLRLRAQRDAMVAAAGSVVQSIQTGPNRAAVDSVEAAMNGTSSSSTNPNQSAASGVPLTPGTPQLVVGPAATPPSSGANTDSPPALVVGTGQGGAGSSGTPQPSGSGGLVLTAPPQNNNQGGASQQPESRPVKQGTFEKYRATFDQQNQDLIAAFKPIADPTQTLNILVNGSDSAQGRTPGLAQIINEKLQNPTAEELKKLDEIFKKRGKRIDNLTSDIVKKSKNGLDENEKNKLIEEFKKIQRELTEQIGALVERRNK